MLVFLIAAIPFVALLPGDPFDPEDHAGASIQCKNDQLKIRRALTAYASEHQARYPARLTELVPDQLDSLPVCKMSNGGVDYESSGNAFQLKCSNHGDFSQESP